MRLSKDAWRFHKQINVVLSHFLNNYTTKNWQISWKNTNLQTYPYQLMLV